MDIRVMQYFVTVAKEKNITRAAASVLRKKYSDITFDFYSGDAFELIRSGFGYLLTSRDHLLSALALKSVFLQSLFYCPAKIQGSLMSDLTDQYQPHQSV